MPRRVVSLIEGVDAALAFEGVHVPSYFYEFTGIRRPRLLTESRVFDDVRFAENDRSAYAGVTRLPVLADSTVNALRFTSIVDLCPGVTFFSTDSLMPPVVVPLERPVEVAEGDTLDVTIEFEYGTDWPSAVLSARV